MKDERWIIEKIEKNSTLDVFFPAGFTSIEFSEWCNAKAFNKLGIALLEPCRSLLGLDLRAPLILSLSRHQKTVLAVVVLSFCRVATPESFKPWHSLIIEVLPEIPHDALDLIMRLLAFDAQFRDTIFSKSGSSVVLRSLATSFAIQSPEKFVTTIKDMLQSQYLTALKLLCALLQRPEGSMAQVCCDFDLCSKVIDTAKEAEDDIMYHSIAFLSMALAPMKTLANLFVLDVFVIIERAINGYYFQAPSSASPPQDAWQRCIVLFLRSTFGLFPHHFVEHFRGRCAQDAAFGKRLKLLAGLVPIHFGLLCDMREELSDTKWQDCDPQSWSLWWVSAPSVPLEECSFQPPSDGLQSHIDVGTSSASDAFKGQPSSTSSLSENAWWDRYLYVCCAAELKRCEAKVLALQCSVDDLTGVHAINTKLSQRVSGYEQKLQQAMSSSFFNRGSNSDQSNFVHLSAQLHTKINSLMKENAALLGQLASTQALLKTSEESRVRAERNVVDQTSSLQSHGAEDPVSAASIHAQFVCNTSRFLSVADESCSNVSFNLLLHRSCTELSFKVKQLEEALRHERYLVSSLRSERSTFLANVDNMNHMFDVARKLTRERQDILEQRWVAASRLNTLLEKRIMQQDMQGQI